MSMTPQSTTAALACLEPGARTFLERTIAADSKPLPQLGVEQSRRYMLDSQRTPFDSADTDVETRVIAGVRTIVVRPRGVAQPLPVVLYLHGGGWVLGAPETHARIAHILALQAQCAVIVVDYALAPEYRYPVALDQCYAIALDLYNNGANLGLDGTRMAVAGDSAGGNLAAALSLLAAERGEFQFALQCLLCPALDALADNPSSREFAEGFNLTAETMRWFWNQYAPNETQQSDPHVSPLHAPNDLLARVAPAWIVTAGCDILRDEAEQFGARLIAAGNAACVLRCCATIHNFLIIDDLQFSAPAIAAVSALCRALHVALHSVSASGITPEKPSERIS